MTNQRQVIEAIIERILVKMLEPETKPEELVLFSSALVKMQIALSACEANSTSSSSSSVQS